MRVKKGSEPRDSEGASDQKQDPLERRRLQNRLSQRNHRRKIRDRITKLQERVIANELRAAAALNGWDQPYSPPPPLGSRNAFQQDSGFGSGTLDASLPVTQPFSAFGSSYGFSLTSPWPGATAQSSAFTSGDSTWLWGFGASATDIANNTPTLCDLMSDVATQPFLGNSVEQKMPDISNTGSPHSSTGFPSTQASQPLYYAVTETALPDILQVLSNASPQSRIIVLVSPNAASSSMEYATTTASLSATSSLSDFSQQTGTAQSTMCQCQSQGTVPILAAHAGSTEWATQHLRT